MGNIKKFIFRGKRGPNKNKPLTVVGANNRIKQIFRNLIGNAIKFTDKGSIHSKLKINEIDSNNIKVEFEVVDTGIGIKKDVLKDLFSVFHQADNSITREFGGTGLGLAISQDLTGMMGGKILVDSIDGEGSQFY